MLHFLSIAVSALALAGAAFVVVETLRANLAAILGALRMVPAVRRQPVVRVTRVRSLARFHAPGSRVPALREAA